MLEFSQLSCQMYLHVAYVFVLLPDWMACLVAIDRYIAVEHGVWYKDNCNTTTAWIPIGEIKHI